MLLGTRSQFAGRTYEVTSILPNGGLRLRLVKDGCKSDGTQYTLGEVCRVRLESGVFDAVVSSVQPLRATVTTAGAWCGYVAGSSKVRKA